ncbi:hypothetical protein CIC12_20255 [Burkholderia sp. SG-MS1]|uniref:PDR/VanB family oxidoreductase n=1 Tax=Paraburkholderia sp. SG-MS1 TaxID=2023741 RepID=UPI0014469036|nr:PDR/VanB family oxidoreductase [Paraburkholderia sp. SG-MS1]NKJ49025.1 hypothetical protein [Paraburkholderia sp. SG-MS1]
MSTGYIDTVVAAIHAEAKDILRYDLVDAQGHGLPPFEPGAHLEVYLPNGLIRHYSLCNDFQDVSHYSIGVGLSPTSRGGSKYLHGALKVGDRLRVSTPRNNFPIDQSGEHFTFIAGGIGITPILAMIRWCVAHGKPWQLHYLARSRLRAAFLDELQDFSQQNVHTHFLDENAGKALDVDVAVAALPSDSHIYCCGPASLMESVQAAGEVSHGHERMHFEWFGGKAPNSGDLQSFKLVLRSSGEELEVPADRSILEVLEEKGHCVPFSCREGLCGSCETRVLSGTPDHRDFILSDITRAEGKSMLICVSRAKTAVLELDI